MLKSVQFLSARRTNLVWSARGDYKYEVDFGRTDERVERSHSFSQILYMELNIFFFAYCSQIYRHNLYLFLTFAVRYVRRILFCKRGLIRIHKDDRYEIHKRGNNLFWIRKDLNVLCLVIVQIIAIKKMQLSNK